MFARQKVNHVSQYSHAKLGAAAHFPIIFGVLSFELCSFSAQFYLSLRNCVKREVAQNHPTASFPDSPDSNLKYLDLMKVVVFSVIASRLTAGRRRK